MIKDSGDRREFSTGAVRDMGGGDKGRCDLLPLDAVFEIYPDDLYYGNMHQYQTTGDIKYLVYAFSCLAQNYSIHHDHDRVVADYLLAVAKHMGNGAAKYGERNWEKGIPLTAYVDSSVRHYLKYRRGDSDEPHLVAAGWNVLCCLATDLRGIAPSDEITKGNNAT